MVCFVSLLATVVVTVRMTAQTTAHPMLYAVYVFILVFTVDAPSVKARSPTPLCKQKAALWQACALDLTDGNSRCASSAATCAWVAAE